MSSQLNFLAGAIEAARGGDEDSVRLLRQICVAACEAAPLPDLIAVAERLHTTGTEMERAAIANN